MQEERRNHETIILGAKILYDTPTRGWGRDFGMTLLVTNILNAADFQLFVSSSEVGGMWQGRARGQVAVAGIDNAGWSVSLSVSATTYIVLKNSSTVE